MEEKEDVRIARSKRDLRAGLMELLKEKPLDKITVGNICDRSTIHKMTFYKHYRDKYDLFDDCIRSLAMRIYMQSIGNVSPAESYKADPENFFIRLAEHIVDECIRQKDAIFLLFYEGNSLNLSIVHTALSAMVQRLVDSLLTVVTPRYPIQYITDFLTGGFSFVILKMLSEKEPNKEEFLSTVRRFFRDIAEYPILFTPKKE